MSRAKLSSSLLTRRAALAAAAPAAAVLETGREEGASGSGQSDLSFLVDKGNRQARLIRRCGLAFCGVAAIAAATTALFMYPSERGSVTMAPRSESVTPATTPFVAAGKREPMPTTEAAMAVPQQAVADPVSAPMPHIPPDEVAILLASGDAALRTADVTTARLYFARATEAENPQAALRLGNTYDPAFLAMAGLKGIHGDAAVAERWYRYAQALGSIEARAALAGIAGNDGISNTPNATNTLFEQFLSRTGVKTQ